ncbi:MAG: hypothetical protein AB7G11_02485 [Phycisphaerales bacterium]
MEMTPYERSAHAVNLTTGQIQNAVVAARAYHDGSDGNDPVPDDVLADAVGRFLYSLLDRMTGDFGYWSQHDAFRQEWNRSVRRAVETKNCPLNVKR